MSRRGVFSERKVNDVPNRYGRFDEEIAAVLAEIEETRERVLTQRTDRALADAARRFVIADLELEESLSRCDPGVVVAAMAAKHDMRLLAGLACGCDEGSCEGLIG